MISRPSHLRPPPTSRLSVVRLSVVRLSAELIWAASESVGSECGYTAEENGCPAPPATPTVHPREGRQSEFRLQMVTAET